VPEPLAPLPADPAHRPTVTWLRAVATLVAGGALAQVLPLLLGPLLTRLFSPEILGHYHLFAAVAANLGVVACARFEFALPLVQDDAQAHALRRLCLRILVGVSAVSALGAAAWWWAGAAAWVAGLPLAVAGTGAVSLATLWATRAQQFQELAAARVVQYGGTALVQVAAGWAGMGLGGLIVAPILACGLATLWLRLPVSGLWRAPVGEAPWALRRLAQQYRDFPLLNTPHAFAGALQDTLSLGLIAATLGPAAAGFWGLSLRYLKAPATLVGGAVSQVLYPRLAQLGADGAGLPTEASRHAVRQVMGLLALGAVPWMAGLWCLGPWLFAALFGEPWRGAGELARALALYIGLHFVAAPLAVVTMAWQAQAWALKLALWGQALFVGALLLGLRADGLWRSLGLAPLEAAGWAVSVAMLGYFGYYFWRLATWPVSSPRATGSAEVKQSAP
jgi:O-antigen/teichoic acid export membrane protein